MLPYIHMPTSLKSSKTCFSRTEYIEYLINYAHSAKKSDRIIIATMGFKPSYLLIGKLMTALGGAAKRGVNVTLLIDAFSFTYPDKILPGPLWYSRSINHSLASKNPKVQLVKRLEQDGVNVIITNKPAKLFSSPIVGRSHIKFAVVGQDAFVGGCNLTDPSHADIMLLRRDDSELAQILANLANKISAAPLHSVRLALGQSDHTHALSDSATLIIDAGTPGVSTIKQRALGLLSAKAKAGMITLQYPPYSALAQTLNSNPNMQIYFNTPNRFTLPNNVLTAIVYIYLRLFYPTITRRNLLRQNAIYMHAKVIVSDNTILIGSHNFVNLGVWGGTAEMAIILQNQHLGREVADSIKRQIVE